MFRSSDVRCAVLLLGLSVLLWAPRLSGPIDLRWDAGVYYVTGTALAQGKGYRLLNEPGEPHAVQYPPLLPAFVAVHQLALGSSDPTVVGPWLRISFFLLFTVYVLAVYGMARQFLTPGYALLVGMITALYVHSYFLSDLLFAEIPFALAATLLVIFNRRSEEPRWFVAAALCGMAAFLLRTAGVALLAAWVAEGVLQRRWKQAALRTAVSLLPLLAWQGYVRRVESSEEYRQPAYAYQRAAYLCYNVSYAENVFGLTDGFRPERGRASWKELAGRALDNLGSMPVILGEGVTANKVYWIWLVESVENKVPVVVPRWLVLVPLTLLGCLILAGAGVLLAQREWFVPLFLAASVGLISLTPESWRGQFSRYLTPVTPFLALCLLRALAAFSAHALQRWPGRGRRLGLTATLVVLALVLGVQVFAGVQNHRNNLHPGSVYPGQTGPAGRLFFYDEKWVVYDAALAWLEGQAGPDDVLATSAPHWAYLRTGRKAVMPPLEIDPVRGQELLDSVPARYVIVDELQFLDVIPRYTAPMIRSRPESWQLVYRVPDSETCVYRRTGESDHGGIAQPRTR